MSQSEELRSRAQGRKPEAEPQTPYQRAGQTWDDRLGSVVKQSRNWRMAALGQTVIILGLIGVVAVQASRRTVEPAIIQVADTGKAIYVGLASKQAYEVGTNEKRYFLTEFLQKVRSVPLDPIVLRNNWLSAYNFMRQGAASKLDAWATGDQSPNAALGKRTVTVQPISVIPINKTTYEVRWEETAYGLQGQMESVINYSGSFVIEIEQPKSEEKITVNPLGIFIKDFSWHKDISK